MLIIFLSIYYLFIIVFKINICFAKMAFAKKNILMPTMAMGISIQAPSGGFYLSFRPCAGHMRPKV
jgi:hypothetical protein